MENSRARQLNTMNIMVIQSLVRELAVPRDYYNAHLVSPLSNDGIPSPASYLPKWVGDSKGETPNQ
jgi:hypothetical protein